MTSRRLAAVPAARPDAPRAVLYLRQSISREDSISLELQETAGREYAERAGYRIVGVEADPGISGRTWDRPAVQRVMGMVEASDVDVVIVWKWSRLSRSRRDWAIAIDRIESMGGRLESATEPVDATTATGRFTRGMLAEMAAFESDRIGEVWREVHQRRLRNGVPASGGARWGYLLEDGTYRPDPQTAPLLAEAYRRAVDGHGMREIATWLNDQGARTLAGGVFIRDRVTRILDSGFAAGKLVRRTRRAGASLRGIPQLSWVDGRQEPIISDETWQAYLAIRTARAHPVGRSTTYLLSGMLTCGDCGAQMHSQGIGHGTGAGFVCSRWLEDKSVRCVTVMRHRAEAAVVEWLGEHAAAIEAAAEATVTDLPVVRARATTAALEGELRDLQRQEDKLLAAFLEDRVDAGAYDRASGGLRGRREAVERRLAEERAVQARAAAGRRTPVTAAMLADWDALPLDEQRVIVRSAVRRVHVIPPDRRGHASTFVVEPLDA